MVDILQHTEMLPLLSESRLRAVRWDLIKWATILDLDFQELERKHAAVYRTWIVLSHTVDFTWPVEKARFGDGVLLVSPAEVTLLDDGLLEFGVLTLTMTFDESDKPTSGPHLTTLSITCSRVDCLRSSLSMPPSVSMRLSDPVLPYEARVRLASDSQMLAATQQLLHSSDP